MERTALIGVLVGVSACTGNTASDADRDAATGQVPDAGEGEDARGDESPDSGVLVLTANAGPDQTVQEGMDGRATGFGADPGGSPLTYYWRQVEGLPYRDAWAVLTEDGRPALGVTTPFVTQDSELVFELIVVNQHDESATDTVTFHVRNVPSDDPDLELGFPVQTYEAPGTYSGGAESLFVAAGNLDTDAELEMMVTATAWGPLWAWNPDGSLVAGWPEVHGERTGYPSIGNLQGDPDVQEVAAGYGPFPGSCSNDRILLTGAGELMPGWPQTSCYGGTTLPPVLADFDGDGIDEIFMFVEGFMADGSRLPGWPQEFVEYAPIAVGDIDADGQLEVVISSYDFYIDARRLDGSSLPGFPVPTDSPGYMIDSVLLGDVNGDGDLEIIRPRKAASNIDYQGYIEVYDRQGQLMWTRRTSGEISYGTSPALADLTGDRIPEIVVQTNGALDIWQGNGDPLPGWPVQWAKRGEPYADAGDSAPVVGDVDGDQLPDVVVASRGSWSSRLHAYSSRGVPLAGFPKDIDRCDARVPVIADVDSDGRNEIIVGGAAWDGIGGLMDALWVFDLGGGPHGRIEWGQLGGDARHRNVYPVP